MIKKKEREKTAEKPGETYHCENLADIVVNGGVHQSAHLDHLAVILFARGKVLENDVHAPVSVCSSYVASTKNPNIMSSSTELWFWMWFPWATASSGSDRDPSMSTLPIKGPKRFGFSYVHAVSLAFSEATPPPLCLVRVTHQHHQSSRSFRRQVPR